jgi:hypothetical protein
MGQFDLALDKDRLQALMNAVMKLTTPYSMENFIS